MWQTASARAVYCARKKVLLLQMTAWKSYHLLHNFRKTFHVKVGAPWSYITTQVPKALFHITYLKQSSHTQPCFSPNRWPVWRKGIEELIMHLLDLRGDMIPSTIHWRVWMPKKGRLETGLEKVYLTVMRSIWVLKSLGWVPGNIS